MWPSCYQNDCSYWGPRKAYDGKTTGVYSMAITTYATNPWMQFDMGMVRTDITAVRITARADGYLYQSQNLNVYLSANTSFFQGTLCKADLDFTVLGQTIAILCPVNITARYLTIWMNGTNHISLQEVAALYDGA